MVHRQEVDTSMRLSPRPAFRKHAAEGALVCAVFALGLDFSRPAFAYLDPGTGSIILQLLLGGVAGGIVVAKLYWHKLKGLVVHNAGGEDLQPKDDAPGE